MVAINWRSWRCRPWVRTVAAVVAILSRSVSEVRAAFDRLTQVLWVTAVIGLLVTALAGYLLARGIIPAPRIAEPRPFPASFGFVPDPRS